MKTADSIVSFIILNTYYSINDTNYRNLVLIQTQNTVFINTMYFDLI